MGENSSYFQRTCSRLVHSFLLLCIEGNMQSLSELSTALPTDAGYQWSCRCCREAPSRAEHKKKTTRKWGPVGKFDSVNLTSQKSSVYRFLHTLPSLPLTSVSTTEHGSTLPTHPVFLWPLSCCSPFALLVMNSPILFSCTSPFSSTSAQLLFETFNTTGSF